MSHTNSIDRLLSELNDTPRATGEEKTASTKTASPVDAAIQAALDQIEGTKTASEASPVADLMKTAQAMRDADLDGEVKHANLLGAAFIDGAMARAEVWREAASETDKLASIAPEALEVLEKFASEHPAEYRELANAGFFAGIEEVEKRAAAEWEEGFRETAALIHKAAADHFREGFRATEEILKAA